MVNKINKLACRVCGKIQDDPPWGEDGLDVYIRKMGISLGHLDGFIAEESSILSTSKVQIKPNQIKLRIPRT